MCARIRGLLIEIEEDLNKFLSAYKNDPLAQIPTEFLLSWKMKIRKALAIDPTEKKEEGLGDVVETGEAPNV
jgi:hypothetical protein